MKRNIARNMSLALLALTLTVLSCNKAEKSATNPEAQDSEMALTPIEDPETAEPETAGAPTPTTAAVAAAAKIKSPVPGYSVSYPYGIRNPRYAAGYHTGDDYAAPAGKKV